MPGLDYQWIQISGADVGGPFSGERPTITAPAEIGALVFEFTVFESGTPSLVDEVTVIVVEDAENALFVDATASSGDGSFDAPYATLTEALSAADAAATRPSIYLAGGTYTGRVDLAVETHIYGGFDAESWKRDPSAFSSRIEGAATAVFMDGASGSVLDGLTIVAAEAAAPGESSIGVHLLWSSSTRQIPRCWV